MNRLRNLRLQVQVRLKVDAGKMTAVQLGMADRANLRRSRILGSWFYGTILGIFLVAFYLKRVGGNAVFIAAILSEILVISIYYIDIISFLWLNVIGAVAVILLSVGIQTLTSLKKA